MNGKRRIDMNGDLFKQYKWQNIVTAVIYILFGIVLAIFPTTAVKTLGYMLGGTMMFVGAVKILLYIKESNQENYYTNDLMIGIIAVIVGLFVVFKIKILLSIIPFLFGLLVLISGSMKLQNVINLKKAGYKNWMAMLIMALLGIVLGIILIINPFSGVELLFRIVGICFIYSGVTDIFILVVISKNLK